MNDIIKKYYKIDECKSFKVNTGCNMKDSEILEKYDELMTIKDNIHIGKLNPFAYLELGDILKSNKKNNYYSSYYKKHNRTVFDTFDMFSSITRLKWLVKTGILKLQGCKQLKRGKAFSILGVKYLLYNLATTEEIFDSYNDSPA